MHAKARWLLVVAALSVATPAVPADAPAIPIAPFLDCAGMHGYDAYIHKRAGNQDAAKAAETLVQFYLQIAEAVNGRSVKQAFIESAERELRQGKQALGAGGDEGYRAYSGRRTRECRDLVKQHQDPILRAVDKMYEAREEE